MSDINNNLQEYIKNIIIATNYIADNIKDNNHLKDILQKQAINLLPLSSQIQDQNNNQDKINELKKTLFLIIDLLEIGCNERVVSEMNLNVYTQGINKFINHLESIKKEETPVSKLLKNLIETQTELERNKARQLALKSNKEIINHQHNFKVEKLEEIDEDTEEVVDESDAESNYEDVHSNPSERKIKILDLLKDKGGQNIKDIRSNIGHVTDKTILRDITELMMERKVFRVGEKRWAKYYLK